MVLTVQIPVTLRIDPALAGHGIGADVIDAVDAAVHRALCEMDSEIIAPRGGYAWPAFEAAEFSWHDHAATSADWQAGIEADVRNAIASAIARAPQSAAWRLQDAPPVLPDHPSEPFDPRRHRRAGYVVPSYEGDVPAPDVPITLQERQENPQWQRGLHLWAWTGSLVGLAGQIGTFLRRLPAGTVSAGTLGLLYNGQSSIGVSMFVAVVTVRDDLSVELHRSFELGNFTLFDADTPAGRRTQEQAVAETFIRRYRTVRSRADVADAIQEFMYERLKLPPEPEAQEAPAKAENRRLIAALATQYEPLYPTGALAAFELPQRQSYICTIPADSFSGNVLRVLPIYSLAPAAARGGAGEGEGAGGAGGGGDGSAGDAGTGDDGVGGGSPAARGSPLAEDSGEGGTRFYPLGNTGETVELDFGPFAGEPSLDELGEQADPLRRLMRQIAFRLEMPMGAYAGAFCIAAAQMIGVRAAAVAGFAETSIDAVRVAQAGDGNLGDVDMAPPHSPAITMIRYIGGTTPLLSRLQKLVVDLYRQPAISAMIRGFRSSDWAGWALDFYKEYTPALKVSVGHAFIRSCQICMLALLRQSAREIAARLDNFDTYYAMVRSLLMGLVTSEAKLEELRRRLSWTEAAAGNGSAILAESYRSWRDARYALTSSLSGQILNAAARSGAVAQGEIVETPDGLRIRDEDGRIWSAAELEQAIAFRHDTATSIDPLIRQFRDIPEVVHTFRQSPTLARFYLRTLLQEMQRNNAEITAKTITQDIFAFRAGKIREDLPNRTIPYTDVALQGIHLMAHQAIGDAFGGDRSYALGVQYVMDVELGRRSLLLFGETISVIALSVICPPAGAALGAAFAAVHYADAAETQHIYGALIEPELILSRAEVEFDLFMAELGLALSIIPEIGSITRGGTVLARSGVRGLSRYARRQMLLAFRQQVQTGLVRHLVREVLTDQGMALLLPQLLGPLLQDINREISILASEATSAHPGGNEHALIRRLEEYQEGNRDESLPPAEEAP